MFVLASRRPLLLVALGACASVAPQGTAQAASPVEQLVDAEVKPFGPVSSQLARAEERVLANGLTVALQPVPEAPEVTVCSAFAAGWSHEPSGKSGVVRLLAEMLKEGGYRSSAQNYAELVAQRGGTNEVRVDYDSTVYCTTVPRAELPLALWVAQSRFTSSALTESELNRARDDLLTFIEAKQHDVFGSLAPERLRRMALLGAPALASSGLPRSADVEALGVADAKAIHAGVYGSNRSFVAVSGGFSLSEVEPLLQTHLATVRHAPEKTDPQERSSAGETKVGFALPPQNTQRFSMAEDTTAKNPAVWYGWLMPPESEREALQLGMAVLLGPNRLSGKLEGNGGPAAEVDFSFEEERSVSLARISAKGRGSQSLATIEKELDSEIEKLAQQPASMSELQAAQALLMRRRALALVTSRDRALELSRGRLRGRSVEEILAPLRAGSELDRPSPELVSKAVARYLAPKLRSIVEVYPKDWQDPWQAPIPAFHLVSSGESLGSIAKRYGTTTAGLVALNKGLDLKHPIYPGDKLRVPRSKKESEPAPVLHQVRRGDTLSGLAAKYDVGVRDITEANGMAPKQSIRIGEQLRIPRVKKSAPNPSSSSVSPKGNGKVHEVAAGETLSRIAAKHGVSAARLAQTNGLSQNPRLKVGQTLKLPEETAQSQAKPVVTHKVKAGDTLTGIAKKYGASVNELRAANGLSRTTPLRIGQMLTVPQN